MSGRLSHLIRESRNLIADRWVEALRTQSASSALPRHDLRNSICDFLEDIAEGVAAEDEVDLGTPAARARLHGEQRFRLGYNIDALIREYGTLREVLYAFLAEQGLHPTVGEAWALSRVLIEGIASAAAQYSQERDAQAREQAARHVGFLAHELRNPLQTAQLRLDLMERRAAGPTEGDLEALRRALRLARERIDNELFGVQLRSFPTPKMAPVNLRAIIDSIVADVAPQTAGKDVDLLVESEGSLDIVADDRLLDSALSNLIRNAVKFSKPGTAVHVRVKQSSERVMVEVEDGCGGLPDGSVEKMFSPFVQLGQDRSGFGLGLAIAKQAAELHGGGVRVHDLPGRGCVFVLDLPVDASIEVEEEKHL